MARVLNADGVASRLPYLSGVWSRMVDATSETSDQERLPEDVSIARVSGGTVVCECGYKTRFDGSESPEEARRKWFSNDHRRVH